MTDLSQLERALGYEFTDRSLLQLALAHRSVGKSNNERLEFLGDSIVNHVIAEALYHRFPQAREGELSRMRASLVKGDTLAEVAAEFNLGAYLSLGPGEKKSGGHRRSSILADAFEAVSGALLLDSDYKTCQTCLLGWFASRLDMLGNTVVTKDPKTRLQEFLQGRGKPLPEYESLHVSGDDHEQVFTVICQIRSPSLSVEGQGSSRRKAEQSAALDALAKLGEKND